MSSGTGGSEGETVPVLDQADEEGEVKKESQATPWFRLLTRPPTLQRSLSCTRSRDTIGRRASTSFSAAAPQLVRLTCRAPLKQATCPSPWADTVEVSNDRCYKGHRGNLHAWYVWCSKDHDAGYVPTSVLGALLSSLVESDDGYDDGHASGHSLDDFGSEVFW